MGREFELKYAATPEALAAVREAFGNFCSISMESTYYDTPDWALAADRVTLRRRLENGVSICTVKTPAAGHGRGEWEVPCEDISLALPQLMALGCPYDLQSLTGKGLRPICQARFTRLATVIRLEDAAVELALDSGVLLGGGKEIPLCEVELELKEGSEAALNDFAAAFAQRFGLRIEAQSKFSRAKALAKGD